MALKSGGYCWASNFWASAVGLEVGFGFGVSGFQIWGFKTWPRTKGSIRVR